MLASCSRIAREPHRGSSMAGGIKRAAKRMKQAAQITTDGITQAMDKAAKDLSEAHVKAADDFGKVIKNKEFKETSATLASGAVKAEARGFCKGFESRSDTR